jgi:adenylate cyclase
LLNGVERGQSADREGDLRRAKEDIATLLAVNANDSYAHALNVYLLTLERQPEQAVAEGERSAALNPGFIETYYHLCSAYIDAGRPEKAIDCVDKAVRLSPHDPSLYGLLMTRAGALATLGRYAEALDWVGRSLALSRRTRSRCAIAPCGCWMAWTGVKAQTERAILSVRKRT